MDFLTSQITIASGNLDKLMVKNQPHDSGSVCSSQALGMIFLNLDIGAVTRIMYTLHTAVLNHPTVCVLSAVPGYL